LSSNAKYQIHSKETAICVELALDAVEGDIRAELEANNGTPTDALKRVLEKLRERRKVVEQFTKAA
jgi:hypothetical protein